MGLTEDHKNQLALWAGGRKVETRRIWACRRFGAIERSTRAYEGAEQRGPEAGGAPSPALARPPPGGDLVAELGHVLGRQAVEGGEHLAIGKRRLTPLEPCQITVLRLDGVNGLAWEAKCHERGDWSSTRRAPGGSRRST